MNSIGGAQNLLVKFRRHRAVLHPRTFSFLFHWLRRSPKVPYLPLKLHLEPTSNCNLRCVMCPQSMGATKGNGYMDMGLYQKIIDEVKEYVLEINLFFRGEPLLHPNIVDMVRIAQAAGITVHLNTNATLLRGRLIERLLDAKLDKLTISFDAGEKEAYEQMRRGAKFEKTLENVQAFLKAKAAYGVNYPYTAIQVIRFFDPAASGPTIPEKFIHLFDGLPVDEFDPLWAHGWAGTMKESESFQAAPYGHNYYPCNWLWKSLAICWDGKVATCCGDFGPSEVFGDLNNEKLKDIWNSPQMVRIRTLQRERKLKELPLCQNCDALWQPDGARWRLFSTCSRLAGLTYRGGP
ncbi:MAG: radical SAM/SPASM domain-containing protein [Chloroflexota bacterium]|jgi:radical SAM protein with 4Fe4S-binding SPASM domain